MRLFIGNKILNVVLYFGLEAIRSRVGIVKKVGRIV